MSSKHIQIVKWGFPAFALIIGLLWYKRRRVDRADPGGISKPDRSKETPAIDRSRPGEADLSMSSFYELGVQFSEPVTFSSPIQPIEENVRSPRKVSESLDIPSRKSQQISMQPGTTEENCSWYPVQGSSSKIQEVQLGSNPKISNFDMVARSRSSSSLDNGIEANVKLLKIFENVTEEEDQKPRCEEKSLNENNECEKVKECKCVQNEGQQPVADSAEDNGNTQAQAISERDSANHSPVSGVLEGSITDEARSEGSTDSGKGGSIKGHAKDNTDTTIYEFNMPQTLVGRLIGRHGAFLQSIRVKAGVHIVVKRHPHLRDSKICSINGTSEGINIALDIIRQKFPEKKYPQVTLEQIAFKGPMEISWTPELMQLPLVEGVSNDIVVCHIVRPNRFFVQLPTHPTYPSLRILDENMTQWYNTIESPAVPEELSTGMILVAKWYNKWVRVYVVQPDPHGEQHLTRLVDHGGYWYFSNAEMRKIRSDYVTLPFQAIEIFLANVQPKDGEWNQEAYDVVAQMCCGIVGQAQIEGYINSNIYVNLYLNIQKHGVISLADELVARGYAERVPLESIVPEEGISFS